MLYQIFLYLHDDFFKFSPDSARDGSFGGFYVKVQIIYDTDKQLVKKSLNIPTITRVRINKVLLKVGNLVSFL